VTRPTRTAIIVVAYHGKRWIPECVSSIESTMERREHLYIIDNSGNEDCIPGQVNHCRYTVCPTSKPLGFAEANNFALRNLEAPVDYICFLNQDTLCRPGWLERCVETMDQDESIGAVTPVLYSFGWQQFNPNFMACAAENRELIADLSAQSARRDFYSVSEIPAAAMVIRSSVLRQTGPFDSIFGSYYEDFDLCRRVRAAGYQVGVCGMSEVAHYDSVTEENLADVRTRRRHQLIMRNRAILKIRNSGDQRFGTFLRCAGLDLPRQLIRSLLRRPGRKAIRSVLGAWTSLLRMTPRLLRKDVDEKIWAAEVSDFLLHFPDSARAVPTGRQG